MVQQKASGGKTNITDEVKEVVETMMQNDVETTAAHIRISLLHEGYQLSLSTIYCCRTSLRWTCHATDDPRKIWVTCNH